MRVVTTYTIPTHLPSTRLELIFSLPSIEDEAEPQQQIADQGKRNRFIPAILVRRVAPSCVGISLSGCLYPLDSHCILEQGARSIPSPSIGIDDIR
jgi:hypothetical protein